MARTLLVPQSFPLATGASYFPTTPLAGTAADLVWTAADAVNDNYVPIISTKTVVLIWNSDASAHTVTIHSVADAQGRTGDITTYSQAAHTVSCFGPFTTTAGWNQTSPAGLYIDCVNALQLIAVLTLP